MMCKQPILLILGLTSLALSACSDSSDTNSSENTEPETEMEAPTDTTDMDGTGNETEMPIEPPNMGDTETSARYELTFEASWSQTTHADNFPPNPHFSGLIGAIHNEQVIFWERGQPATPGIELMAETGSKSDLRSEIQEAIDNGSAVAMLDEGGIGLSPGEIKIEFDVNSDYHQITLVSMLAPSPDWFVGVHNLNLRDENGFIESSVIELALYDAGTDSGPLYTSGNDDTDPAGTITRLTTNPDDLPFIDGLPQVGRFIINKL